MKITDVRVRKITREGKMKAIVSITIDDEFVVHDIKVIEGEKGLFIAMPSKRPRTENTGISLIRSTRRPGKASRTSFWTDMNRRWRSRRSWHRTKHWKLHGCHPQKVVDFQFCGC